MVAYGSAIAQRIKATPGIKSEKRLLSPLEVIPENKKRLITVEIGKSYHTVGSQRKNEIREIPIWLGDRDGSW